MPQMFASSSFGSGGRRFGGRNSVASSSACQHSISSASGWVAGSGGSLAGSQDIDAAELEVCKLADGSDHVLGRGSFGTVYKALRRGVQEVAVKKVDRGSVNWLHMLHKEIAILSKVSFDKHIVQYYGACLSDPQHPLLVMEYMAGGDLRQAFVNDDSGAFAWDRQGRDIAIGIARGLHFLHSSGVVHRDLKTANVLLSAEGVAKISDVGLAKMLSNADQQSLDTTAGTFAYAAPELILGLRCTEKADIYSYGVVLWELVTKELARRGSLRDVEVPAECPQAVSDLIDDCLRPNPQRRPSAAEVFQRLQRI